MARSLRNDCNYDYFYTDEPNISEVRQDWDRVLWRRQTRKRVATHFSGSPFLVPPWGNTLSIPYRKKKKKKALMRGLDSELLSLARERPHWGSRVREFGMFRCALRFWISLHFPMRLETLPSGLKPKKYMLNVNCVWILVWTSPCRKIFLRQLGKLNSVWY